MVNDKRMTEPIPPDNIDKSWLALLEHLDEAAFVTNEAGVVQYISPNASRILGRSDFQPGDSITQILGSKVQLETPGDMHDLRCAIVDSSGGTRYLLVRVKQAVIGAGTCLYLCRCAREGGMSDYELWEKEAHEFQYYLKQLHTAHMELAHVDWQHFYRRVIEIGLQRLDFDRMGLMLIDYEANEMVGVYGTDATGQPRDEGHYRISLDTEGGRVWAALRKKDHVSVWKDIPITEYSSIIGQGWNAIAGIWNGDRATAFLSIDNFVSKRPIRSYEADLLSLYASVVGSVLVRKQAENTLRASENRFRTLLEAAPLGVLLVNQNGRIISANYKAQELFGCSQAEIEQIELADMIPPTDRNMRGLHGQAFIAHLLSHSTTAGVTGLDLYGRRKDGYMFPLDVALGTFESEDELLVIAFITDVTERRLADVQSLELRIERERTGILTNFMRDAAHEFRTPLSIINTNLYLLDKVDDPQRREEIQARIQEQTDSITRLIEVLTTMTRLDYGVSEEMAPVNINNIVRATFSRMRSSMDERSLRGRFEDTEHVALVMGDAGDLTLALSCLLENAIRYTPPGGEIRVSTERDGDDQVITIADTGIGMTQDVAERIFERFYRADSARTTRGFGLGLSIARTIIEYHGGSIQVKSAPDSGSTFHIRLPLLAQS
jgi:PAS domain S-box-containing protein